MCYCTVLMEDMFDQPEPCHAELCNFASDLTADEHHGQSHPSLQDLGQSVVGLLDV